LARQDLEADAATGAQRRGKECLCPPLPDREAWISKLPKQKSDSADIIGDNRER